MFRYIFGVVIYFCRAGSFMHGFHGFKMEREGREYPPLSSLREAHQFFSNIKISTEVILEIIIVCGICKTHFHIDIEIHNTYR